MSLQRPYQPAAVVVGWVVCGPIIVVAVVLAVGWCS